MKRTKMEKGITLIALIITILVLLILAAVTIGTITDNDGILVKAEEAAGKYNTKAAEEQNELSNLATYLATKAESLNGGSGDNGDIIPIGAVYYTGHTLDTSFNSDGMHKGHAYSTKLVAGQKFPETITPGDVYVYGDYAYTYGIQGDMDSNGCYYGNETIIPGGLSIVETSKVSGWGVTYIGNGGAAGEILSSVRGQNVVSMSQTFYYKNITSAPTIPSTVRNLDRAFTGCTSLTGAITINTTPSAYERCLEGTNITQILGSCDEAVKAAILATK